MPCADYGTEPRHNSPNKAAGPSAVELLHHRFGDKYSEASSGYRPPDEPLTYGEWFDRAKAFPLIPPSALHTIYLFDEPERHLHPVAQIEARNWVAGLVEDPSCSVILATHSPEFLDIPLDSTQYLDGLREA